MINNILKNKKINYIMTVLLVLACPALCIYISNYILRQGLVVTLRYVLPRWKIASIGYVFFLLLTVIITLVFRKVALAYFILGSISAVGAAAHYFKTVFRGEVLFPSDIIFLSSATDMVLQFNLQLTSAMKISIVILAVVVLFSALFTLPKLKNKYSNNIIAAVVFGLLTVCHLNNNIFDIQYYKDMGFYETSNPIDVYYANTFHTAYLFYVNTTTIDEPDDYSQQAVSSLVKITDSEETERSKPDIIMIQLESYLDPNKIFGLEFSQPINENYINISSKSIYGNMLSFKYGGGTADIEFNVLNQINTTNFSDAISYMNVYGNKELPAFVHTLKSKGYRTYAMHAYTSQLFNRINAYRNIGFDGVSFVDDYQNRVNYGNYVSDISQVDEMIAKYEEYRNKGDESILLYGVSMQSHMYMAKEIKDRIYLDSKVYSDSFTEGMGILASYMRQTDMAIKKLYDYFENVDREVVIILYGDHQSYNVEGLEDFSTESLSEIALYQNMTMQEKYIASHTTPFIMWSNKQNMDGQYWPLISPHNIWALASQSFNLPSTEYERYLYDVMEKVPVINEYAGIWCDRNGKIYEERPELANSIHLLSYDRLFGKQYSLNVNKGEG